MNTMPVLLKREFQEHRGVFFWFPAIITLFWIGLLIIGVIMVEASPSGGLQITMVDEYNDQRSGEREVREIVLGSDQLTYLAGLPERQKKRLLGSALFGSGAVLHISLWFVMFFYFLGALYYDRRDRSVLFWRSMPVSDANTVFSKLLAGLVLAPVIYMIGAMIIHLMLLVSASVVGMMADIDVWETIWAPSDLVGRWFRMIALYAMCVLWAAPFYGWILLVSSWAKSIPLVWVIGVPIGVGILDKLFLPGAFISSWIGRHIFPFVRQGEEHLLELDYALEQMMSLEFVFSLAIGVAFIYAAIRIRGRADEI